MKILGNKKYPQIFRTEYITKEQVEEIGAVWLEKEQMWGVPAKKWYSISEHETLMKIRMQDPEYRKWREDGEKERLEMHKKIDAEAKEYVNDLKEIGFNIPPDKLGFWALEKEKDENIEKAIPVIMKHLRKNCYHRRNIESLLYTLARVKKHPEIADELLDLFVERHELGVENTWGRYATAIEVTGTKENVDKLIKVMNDTSLGWHLYSFVPVLIKLAGKKDERIKEILLNLLEVDNNILKRWVIEELRKIKFIEAYDKILPFTSSKDSNLRKVAKKSIKNFDILLKRGKK